MTAVVERPESVEAKQWTKKALETNLLQPPSVQLNSDVREIAAREKAKLKARGPVSRRRRGKELQPARGILGKRAPARVCIPERHTTEFVIQSDNEGKNLRSVKK